MTLFLLRLKNFLRTGSFRFPALNSNISSALQSDLKLAEAHAKIEAHEASIVVRKISLDALKERTAKVQSEYAKLDSAAHSLLTTL